MTEEHIEYIFFTRVHEVKRMSRIVRAYKIGDSVTNEIEDLGWFILLEGSYERLYVGMEEPTYKPGDQIEVILRKSKNANNQQAPK